MEIGSGSFARIVKRQGNFEILSEETTEVKAEYSTLQHPLLTPDAIWHIVSHFKTNDSKSVHFNAKLLPF
jgi:hypothetical protein